MYCAGAPFTPWLEEGSRSLITTCKHTTEIRQVHPVFKQCAPAVLSAGLYPCRFCRSRLARSRWWVDICCRSGTRVSRMDLLGQLQADGPAQIVELAAARAQGNAAALHVAGLVQGVVLAVAVAVALVRGDFQQALPFFPCPPNSPLQTRCPRYKGNCGGGRSLPELQPISASSSAVSLACGVKYCVRGSMTSIVDTIHHYVGIRLPPSALPLVFCLTFLFFNCKPPPTPLHPTAPRVTDLRKHFEAFQHIENHWASSSYLLSGFLLFWFCSRVWLKSLPNAAATGQKED